MVLPAKQLNEAGFFDQPVSAGPYLLKSVQGHDVTLEVNPHYYGPKPAIKTLKLVTIEDPNSRVAQLKSGQIDFAFDLPPSLLPTLESTPGVTASVVPGYGWYSLDMWNEVAPLDNPKVRRAISMAIDREQLSEVIWQGKNQGLAGFWPETMAGYEPEASTGVDVEAAKKELAGTECASGCTIELEYPPALVPFADQMALLISSDLEAIGIKVTITKVDFNTFYADLGGGKYQMALYGLYDFVNMPDGLLTYALSAEGGINANFSGYSSPATTKLIERTLQSSGAEQTKALAEVNETFATDQPFATLATWAYVPATRLPADLMAVEGSGLLYVGSTE
jgi:ABC-type transport system substrate-binding protein